MITRLLIANRGEIACRIIRTARRLGITTIAVYSEPDANALHVRMADEALAIGGSLPGESYLLGEKIIAAAKASGAEAIHPGYGFLSENADFARLVTGADLIWVGPDASSIMAMGLKDAAKTRMQAAGVPVTPGYWGECQEVDFLAGEAERIGYPVLIKAVAGGGGKGMRRVDSAADFSSSLTSCQREAIASFGNARVLIEKYIAKPRHIEVQIFGDTQGHIVHLFERDCSLQRRHQKVIEEAPAPGMDEATRAEVCAMAVLAAQSVNYVGAGTIEFIADGSSKLSAKHIWFMEMNTRLQVEHPVTEEITGVDLVEWQLRVACGEPLPCTQSELTIKGHAMEARLYAEDPARGFLPSIGKLSRLQLGLLPGGRIEAGVSEGDVITPFYDPMIAKLIAHGKTRDEARTRLRTMLANSSVGSVKTNTGFLVRALDHAAFVAGGVDTGLIAREGDAWSAPRHPSSAALTRAADALVAASPLAGFRFNAAARTNGMFLLDGEAVTVKLSGQASTSPVNSVWLCEEGETWKLTPWRKDGKHTASANGDIVAPMPGRVIAIDIAEGQKVTMGQRLLTLEAMKMEHALLAPFDGVVARLTCVSGSQVQVDTLLARIDAYTKPLRC